MVTRVFTAILMALSLIACQCDEPKIEDEPQIERHLYSAEDERFPMSINEAKALGYQWVGPDHIYDDIYPEKEITVVLTKDNKPVEINLLTMASLKSFSLLTSPSSAIGFRPDYNKELLTFCSDDNYYIFVPYHLTAYTGIEVIQKEPTKIIIKGDHSNPYRRYGYTFTFHRGHKPNFYDLDKNPKLKVTVIYE